jgi:Transposase zinc-ribbon domain
VQVNITHVIDDVQCYQTVRELRWPDGIAWPSCESQQVIKRGVDDTEPARQRYECPDCHTRGDDLPDTMFAGHHQPLKVWVFCLSFMGLNIPNEPIAYEWALHGSDVPQRTTPLREGIVKKRPQWPSQMQWNATKPMGEQAIKASRRWYRTRGEKDGDADSQAKLVVGHWRRTDHPSLA